MPDRSALVAILLGKRPLCAGCIAEKSGVDRSEVEPLLTRIGVTIALSRVVGPCPTCNRIDRVYAAFGPK